MSYNKEVDEKTKRRGVAQLGSARGLGPWGRGFKSSHPDQLELCNCNSYKVFLFFDFLFPITKTTQKPHFLTKT